MGDISTRTNSIEQYKEFSKNTLLCFYPGQKIDNDIIFNTSNFSAEEITDGSIKEFLRENLSKSYNKNRNHIICYKLELISLIELKVY